MPKTTPFLYSTDGCTHRVCQSCMDAYADHSVNQQRDNQISTLPCPVQGCTETFQLDQVISKALPFRHRLVFWWRQATLRVVQDSDKSKTVTKVDGLNVKPVTKSGLARSNQPTLANNVPGSKLFNSLVEPPPKARNVKPPKTTRPSTTDSSKSKTQTSDAKHFNVISKSKMPSSSNVVEKLQKDATKEFVEFALAKNWSRCPNCRHVVERISGCNFIYCRCGANFCYRCGKQHGYHHSACPDKFNGKELQAVRKAMFQN
ncbi:hypothetical protein BJV82DRAFT_653997 [Fennellomyces sp. T-0311]|nr:hypothetical protein BJV82DRAFT_653997 [Fennellomyces sp. T-0311]